MTERPRGWNPMPCHMTDHPGLARDPLATAAYYHLFCRIRRTRGTFTHHESGRVLELQPGQCVVSERELAERLRCSKTGARGTLLRLAKHRIWDLDRDHHLTVVTFRDASGFLCCDWASGTASETTARPPRDHRETTPEPQRDRNDQGRGKREEVREREGVQLALTALGSVDEPTPSYRRAPRRARDKAAWPPELEQHRATALALWAEQEQHRHAISASTRGLAATDRALRPVAERLAEGYSAEDCRHVLRVYAAEASGLQPDPLQWLNGQSNWRPDNFARALGKTPATFAAGTMTGSQDVRFGRMAPRPASAFGPAGAVDLRGISAGGAP
jgi:hypothetical protein